MAVLDKVLGPLLIGNWVNSFLFVVEVYQLVEYYSYHDDYLFLKAVVTFAFLVDVVSSINSLIMVYLYQVTHWGDVSYLIITHWPLSVNVITVCITTTIVQAFLIQRYFAISRNWVISIFLILVIVASIVGCVGTIIGLMHPVPFEMTPMTNKSLTLLLTTASGCGVIVATCTVWELSRVQTAFKSTKSLVRRLSAAAIQAGSAPAIVDMITLITYLRDHRSNVGVAFALCAGRVYTLTMLWNLNMRRRKRGLKRMSGHPADLSDSLQLTGIHVHRTAIVHIDENQTTNHEVKSFSDVNVIKHENENLDMDEQKEINLQLSEKESKLCFHAS